MQHRAKRSGERSERLRIHGETPSGWHRADSAVVRFVRTLDGRIDVVTEKIFESALGISSPWFIAGMNFEPSQRKLNIRVNFEVGS